MDKTSQSWCELGVTPGQAGDSNLSNFLVCWLDFCIYLVLLFVFYCLKSNFHAQDKLLPLTRSWLISDFSKWKQRERNSNYFSASHVPVPCFGKGTGSSDTNWEWHCPGQAAPVGCIGSCKNHKLSFNLPFTPIHGSRKRKRRN